jgi:hypothetical protein
MHQIKIELHLAIVHTDVINLCLRFRDSAVVTDNDTELLTTEYNGTKLILQVAELVDYWVTFPSRISTNFKFKLPV